MKRKLFVGSSKEGQSVADMVKNQIEKQCNDWIIPETWSDGGIFMLNKAALDSLLRASRRFDYGVLIATKDDLRLSRGNLDFVPRDNVMFEMGMFLGSLGLTRAFLLVEEETKLPTDYNGVTVSYFNRSVVGSLDKAIGQIVKNIEDSRFTFNLKPVPSAALALGYFANFVQPFAKRQLEKGVKFQLEILLPTNIKDIYSEAKSYKISNPSTEVSVYDDGQRPRANMYTGRDEHYWDMPTTLVTLSTLIDHLIPSQELGNSQEKKDWIEHEVRNFAGTLQMLSNDCAACRGNIEIKYH